MFLGDGQILHKLHCPERDIMSLAWCPVPYSPLSSDQSSQSLLLASTAFDSTGLNIWRIDQELYSEATILLPNKPQRNTIFK